MLKFFLNLCNITKDDIIKKYIFENFSDKFKIDFIKWFIGEDGADKDIVQARRQAVEAYPVLAYKIYNEKEIREAVEQKKPLAPVLAKYLDIDDEKIIKRIRGKTWSELELNDIEHLDDIFDMKENHFQHLKNNLPDLNILRKYAECVYDMSLHEFLDYLLLQSTNPCQHIDRMKQNNINDIIDAVKFLQTRLFIPAFLNKVKDYAEKNNLIYITNSSDFYIVEKIFLKYTNIKTILDFSDRYHRNLFRWEDMFNFDSGMKHISWQPMFGEIDLRSGWKAREICSVAALKEQGRRENHCVGGYAGSILERYDRSARLIFSLEKTGLVKSTIDMICRKNKKEDGCDVEIQQNRAHSNKDPSKEALNFSHHLFEIIKKQPISKLNTYLQNLRPVREKYESYQTKNKYLSRCGYNPWDREILENVWDEFKPVLPAKLRRLGLDGFIDMMPIHKDNFRPKNDDNELNLWDLMKNEEVTQINREYPEIVL